MRRAKANLWSFSCPKVIPTNLGWSKAGRAVMGAGVARQAAARHPHLPIVWGTLNQQVALYPGMRAVALDSASNCINFPTKELDVRKPAFSWRLPSTMRLLLRSTVELIQLTNALGFAEVALPLVGGGCGGLPREDVLSVIGELLDARFILVELDDLRRDDLLL